MRKKGSFSKKGTICNLRGCFLPRSIHPSVSQSDHVRLEAAKLYMRGNLRRRMAEKGHNPFNSEREREIFFVPENLFSTHATDKL